MAATLASQRKCMDLTGHQYGFWTVIERFGSDARRNRLWVCQCVCGKVKHVGGQHLRSGASKSCGCKTAGLRGSALRGSKHYNWKGGQKNRGSLAWCAAKLDSLRQGRKRRGGAEIVSTPEEVMELWSKSGGRCMACGRTPKSSKHLHLDHEYATGLARGFLCDTCNVAIGMAQDCPGVLRQCAAYLDNYRINKDGKVRTV